ncbi:LysR family transcriptional regulator [Burkholderia lata]|uniref:LysR family transcriptional regulator n=1 Tax=Burkholderia lata (strain ATCC 17760 / DSM 23089 / LMG 22485 / NCIMB 9086 / R18194 / 383) TaxID=482957 RepID=A0A6P2USC3_BURL3|nr:LysR family transcriptional regulator [Burkholderia lata]VWC72989.1 LysR family transcriptional regulator [Burkholderia lata]
MLRTGIGELTTFITIAEQRSFSGAARILGVSPSALSHAVRHLEARLGVRLFNRTTRSVALTEAGEQLLLRVRPAVADLEDALNDAATARNRPSGQIRISASEAAARPLIRHVLPAFVARYPDIHVEFVTDSRLIDIVEHGFDAGIRVHEDVPRDMIAVKFGDTIRFVAVASPDYLSRHTPPARPQDLVQHRCIRYRFESGALYRWDLIRKGKRVSVDVDGPMTLGNQGLMIDAALAGIGIAWVTESRVAEHVVAGRLVPVLPEWSQDFGALCLYYPANRHPPAALRLFVEAVREWVAAGREAAPA